MSQPQTRPQATDAFGFETDGRNRSKAVDRMAVLREIHLSLIRAEQNTCTLLEATAGEPADHRNTTPIG